MVTIKDVAKHANVSIASASYALNGNGTISEITRKKVLESAKKLNYHPNAFAKNLKKGRSHSIGVFISRFGGSFYEDILEGIHDAVLQTDYELIVCPESETIHKTLSQRQVDGAIVFDSKIKSEIIIDLASKRFPIVVMDRYIDAENVFPILIDNANGSREVFYHFFDQGFRSIAYVSGALDSFDNAERMNAFLHEADKKNVITNIFPGNFTELSGAKAAVEILSGNTLPEAVFCANDQMAIGLIKVMKEHNIQIPRDIAVVGFDDIPISRVMQPSLSTVGASREVWGSSAVNHLIDYLDNETPYLFERIPTKLIPRESSQKNMNHL